MWEVPSKQETMMIDIMQLLLQKQLQPSFSKPIRCVRITVLQGLYAALGWEVLVIFTDDSDQELSPDKLRELLG